MITTFTPFEAVLGGFLIGTAAVALMALHGRAAGMTGILTGALLPSNEDRGWRIAFLAGAVLAPVLIFFATGAAVPFETNIPTWAVALGGLLVGLGVTLAAAAPLGTASAGWPACRVAPSWPRSPSWR
jgi:uncharacterized membrane protein YedE/YeeE